MRASRRMEQLKCMYWETEKKESELNQFPSALCPEGSVLDLGLGFKMGHLAHRNARGASHSCSVHTSRAMGKHSWYLQLS